MTNELSAIRVLPRSRVDVRIVSDTQFTSSIQYQILSAENQITGKCARAIYATMVEVCNSRYSTKCALLRFVWITRSGQVEGDGGRGDGVPFPIFKG